MYYPTPTRFERLFASRRRPTRFFSICAMLILLPFLAAYLDGELIALVSRGTWRFALVHPVVIIYILLVSPPLDRVSREVVDAFRPLVSLDDDGFNRLIQSAGSTPALQETLVAVAGGTFGVWWAVSFSTSPSFSWLTAYLILANGALFSLLAWTIYLSFVTTRLTTALHRQRLKVDIFDITPFQTIGKQSLAIALAFVGGIMLGLIFGVEAQSFRQPIFWVLYLPMALVPVVIFFLNMLPTHRVLSAEKKRLQKELQPQIIARIHSLEASLASGSLPPGLAAELSVLSSYEERLQNTRTWPYNTTQLRTLFFSVLIPGASMLLKLILDNWQNLEKIFR